MLQVKAVVVDSTAAPFRAVEGMQWQHQPVMLANVGRMLRRIAAQGIIVVVLNQVVGGASGGNSDVKPALGT
jgi:RecA/RadA recombinase